MRFVAAVLAFGGAVALVAACFLPILEAGAGEPAFELLDFDGSAWNLFYALEPLAAAVLAGGLATMLFAVPETRVWLGLLVTGIWMTAFFVSYAGVFASDDVVSLGSGEAVGLLGGVALLAAAFAARSAEAPPAEAPAPAAEGGPPAGWYADPAGGGGMRWWDGRQWTHETRSET